MGTRFYVGPQVDLFEDADEDESFEWEAINERHSNDPGLHETPGSTDGTSQYGPVTP